MQIGNEQQPSVVAYNKGYENQLQAYTFYKDQIMYDKEHLCVSYDSWRSRYGVVYFDYRGQLGLFEKLEPFIVSEVGKN